MSTKYLKVRDLEINSELVMAMKPCWSKEEVEQYLSPGTSLRIEEIIELEYVSYNEKLWLVGNMLTGKQILSVAKKLIRKVDDSVLERLQQHNTSPEELFDIDPSYITLSRLCRFLEDCYRETTSYGMEKQSGREYTRTCMHYAFMQVWKGVRNLKVHPISEWSRAYYIELYMSQPGIWG